MYAETIVCMDSMYAHGRKKKIANDCGPVLVGKRLSHPHTVIHTNNTQE